MTEDKFADEMLSDDELDQIAGGTDDQTTDDNMFLYEHGLVDVVVCDSSKDVDAGWAKAGITCVTKFFSDNQYFIGGKSISRNEAYDIVKSKFKKIRNVEDAGLQFCVPDS